MDAKVCEWLADEGTKKKSERSHQSILTLLKRDFAQRHKIISGLQETHKQNDQLLKVLLEKYPVYADYKYCLLYTSPSPRDGLLSRMPSSA